MNHFFGSCARNSGIVSEDRIYKETKYIVVVLIDL